VILIFVGVFMRLLCVAFLASGCSLFSGSNAATDARDADAFEDGERIDLDDCTVRSLLAFVNDVDTDLYTLKEAGIHTQASKNIVKVRDGADSRPGTEDDTYFETLAELDDVPYVGPVAMEQLAGYGAAMCDGSSGLNANCAEEAALSYVNDPSTSAESLKLNGVHTRAANNIISTRDGADGLAGTADDHLFNTIGDLDDVAQVGPSALDALLSIGGAECVEAEVIFSPRDYDASHLARVKQRIEEAEYSLDVAMYSFSDSSIMDSLEAAVSRGVSIRFLYEGAADDRKDVEGTRSADLEDLGIEVRWINKIMHHKFALIDGPRSSVDQAATARLLTGSGNWSYSAGTRYDENMTDLRGDARLVLRFQQEFNTLWDNARLVEWNETIPATQVLEITDAMIEEATGSEAVFTSANFRTYISSSYGPTFTREGTGSEVAERLVKLIESADKSVKIASGHLRSRMISDALLAKAESDPQVTIQVYLDGQEYVSEWYFNSELEEHQACLDTAEDADDVRDCDEAGYYFGNALHQAGIDLRYKYYAYRWDYTYALQMHHKYVIIDDSLVASGSYNFSNNAEHATMENLVIYDGVTYPNLVASFSENFANIWPTGRAEGHYDSLWGEIEDGSDDFPIVFDSMALDWDEITALKDLIRVHCPDINSEDYREDPASHWYCER
jgi:phosphatidylserine/phosphatidylglycerophosphate/cardiolipin synthase-like enzyme